MLWEPWVTIAAVLAVYGIAALYFFRQRKKVSFMTRSPITIAISVLFLAIDCVLQTLIFSQITLGNMFHWQCNLAILATIFGQFGFMLVTSLRIYRISNIYNCYLGYLEL